MATNVTQAQVADLIAAGDLEINDGYRAKNAELSSNGLPFARSQNIKNGFRFDNADRFPEEHLDRVGAKVSREGDVVFTSEGTVGRFAFVRADTPDFVYSPQLCFWRSVNRDRINPRWLFYWMQSRVFLVQYSGVAGQTDMAENVSLRDQRGMNITLPSLDQQRTIAHILGTLDDKIELNRRMNATLEEMARAIFKSWFVDFDPVRSKAEGRDPGLPKPIADLFPDRFEDSELGEIPAEWWKATLSEVMEINPRRSLKKGEVAPYLDMKNMPTQSARALRVYNRKFGSGVRFVDNDTLVARITPCLENGKTCSVDSLGEGIVGWGSTEYVVLRPKQQLPAEFAYFLARTGRFRTYAISSMSGTSGRQRESAASLDQFVLAVPPAEVARAFGKMTRTIMNTMKAKDEESRTLAAIRDALLPRLISGELRVPDAERMVEAALREPAER